MTSSIDVMRHSRKPPFSSLYLILLLVHAGLKLETEALMKNLNLGNSPKGKSPKTPVGPAKYHEKAAQCMSPKYGPRRINQPR